MTTCPWSDYAPGTIAFCEARLCAWVVEPSNAWSNLAYVIFGALILSFARRRAPVVVIGVASVLMGIGSFSFHGTGTRWGELADLAAMYLLSGLAIVFLLRRMRPMTSTAFVATYVGLVAGSVALMMALHNNGIFMFAGQLLWAIGAEIYMYTQRPAERFASYRYQKLMLASFFTGFAIWNTDKWNVLCDPNNHLVTGHAVWHVLSAATIYYFALHQRQRLT